MEPKPSTKQQIINFIKEVVLTEQEKDSIKNFTSLQKNYTDLKKEESALIDALLGEQIRVESLKEKINSLLAVDTIDINSLQDWFEGRRNQNTWLYDGNRLGKVDVKNYLDVPKEKEFVLEQAAKEIIKKYQLVPNSKVQTIIQSVMKYFMLRGAWRYLFDQDKYKSRELWERADISWEERTGDCEDLAILMHNLWYYILKHFNRTSEAWRLTFTAGLLTGAEGGHAYNTFLHDDGNYYVVESTYDLADSFHKTWLETPIINNNLYKSFYGFSTKLQSWRGSNSALNKYEDTKK